MADVAQMKAEIERLRKLVDMACNLATLVAAAELRANNLSMSANRIEAKVAEIRQQRDKA